MTNSLLTLTTDFGTRDAYVAAMKGVILGLAPDVTLIDVTHEVSPQDIMGAAFVLREAYPYFRKGTVHLVVVDPGVGTTRAPLAIQQDGHYFVGPDNGLFSLVLGGDAFEAVVRLDRPDVWRTSAPSHTFHGRDIFAPAAAQLARGEALHTLGTPIDSVQRLHWALPFADGEGVQGWVVHMDHFGNAITNIPGDVLDPTKTHGMTCYVGSSIIRGMARTYGTVDVGEPLVLVGSSGYVEVAINGGHAGRMLSIKKGDSVSLMYSTRPTVA